MMNSEKFRIQRGSPFPGRAAESQLHHSSKNPSLNRAGFLKLLWIWNNNTNNTNNKSMKWLWRSERFRFPTRTFILNNEDRCGEGTGTEMFLGPKKKYSHLCKGQWSCVYSVIWLLLVNMAVLRPLVKFENRVLRVTEFHQRRELSLIHTQLFSLSGADRSIAFLPEPSCEPNELGDERSARQVYKLRRTWRRRIGKHLYPISI